MASSTLYDPIMDALLARLKLLVPVNVFQSFARGCVMWEKLGAMTQDGRPLVRQPALYLYDGVGFGGGRTHYSQKGRGTPAIRVFDRTIVIYGRTPSAGGLPGGTVGGKQVLTTGGGPVLHPLIEAVETAMETADDLTQGTLTLGGLVSHCWIEGDGMLLSPELDDNGQGMATLPVKIMIP